MPTENSQSVTNGFERAPFRSKSHPSTEIQFTWRGKLPLGFVRQRSGDALASALEDEDAVYENAGDAATTTDVGMQGGKRPRVVAPTFEEVYELLAVTGKPAAADRIDAMDFELSLLPDDIRRLMVTGRRRFVAGRYLAAHAAFRAALMFQPPQTAQAIIINCRVSVATSPAYSVEARAMPRAS